MTGLRDLDDRVVPRAAARLRAVVGAGRALRTRVATVAVPPGPGVLRRLDERYARSGPLALLRDAPQAGLAVAGAVLLAGAGVAVARGGDPPPDRGSLVADSSVALGPEVGDDVAAYVEGARKGAAALSADDPEAQHIALVSLTSGLQPDAVQALLEGLEVQRVYLKVPSSDPGEVLSTDVEDLVPDLRALYAATADRKAEDREELVRLSRGIAPTTAEQTRLRDVYELSGRLAAREAQAYRKGCACVFAVVVRGSAAQLAALPALSGVRAVELAPEGVALEALRVRPLGPEQTTTVQAGPAPRPAPAGG